MLPRIHFLPPKYFIAFNFFSFIVLAIVFVTFLISTIFDSQHVVSKIPQLTRAYIGAFNKNDEKVIPVAKIKPGNKWIVVTSINSPTEDVKRLNSFEKWNLVVVADTKTPMNWTLDGAHFLSVEYQLTLPFSLITSLPFKSYTRKNIGYLYAISQGAEWIYDTDDDNKPYGKGLDQFMYEEEISGVRYRLENGTGTDIRQRLFNPYRFYGFDSMWPRGFPLEYLKEHTNGEERMSLCGKMNRPAVQQGLVHHDPDVDAIYRLLHADPNTGLNERFNKFAPPITLSPGTYSPWNSQNTLFHKSAFHTLFLPTTVSFRTTDIWRSYYAQKILHLSGFSVAFTPVNAVQYRNPHSFLKDFEDELQVYKDSGAIINFLNEWECFSMTLDNCMIDLANEFAIKEFWSQLDVDLIIDYINDLRKLNFTFPYIVHDADYQDYLKYTVKTNETVRDHNCRRMSISFDLNIPENNTEPALIRAEQKVASFGEIGKWCNESGYEDILYSLPSPEVLAAAHSEDYVLSNNLQNVLIITNNFDWSMSIGLLQRMYDPYFALVIFCGTWNKTKYDKSDKGFPKLKQPFNYIHMNKPEMYNGYFAYHCMTLARQLNLQNVQGYYMMSDDVIFNIWQRINFKRVHHLVGIHSLKDPNWWKTTAYGLNRVKAILEDIKTTKDKVVLQTWFEFEARLKKFRWIEGNQTAFDEMRKGVSRSISDFFYVPSTDLDYFARLMHIFFKHKLFHELAINKFLRTVDHQTSRHEMAQYLWDNRGHWDTIYTKEMVAMHPVKLSAFAEPNHWRKLYCSTIIQTWDDILMNNSKNYTVKGDTEPSIFNG